MDDSFFDIIILGTGLTESIAAAALSKAGFKVAHLDENPYYGGNEASLSLDEFVKWIDSYPTGSSRSSDVPTQSRQYSICLSPSVIPAIGPLISSLVSSGVAKYGGFQLLERVGVYHPSGTVKSVPGSKEDVFKDKDISLMDKRRLMRFLLFAAGDFEDKKELEGCDDLPFHDFLKSVFSLNDEMITAVSYSLAYCASSSDHTLPALHRIRRYLRSTGRYGPSPFLIGHYGGVGDIAQGFCRSAAVCGAVYILSRRVSSITPSVKDDTSTSDTSHPDSGFSVSLDDFPDTLSCKLLISSSSRAPSNILADTKQFSSTHDFDFPVARCMAIIDQPLYFGRTASREEESDSPPQQGIDNGILVYPPSSLPEGSANTTATVLVTGEGSMSTPRGKWILYISLPLTDPETSQQSAESLLKPYLAATLALNTPPSSSPSPSPTLPLEPIFYAFYTQHPPPTKLPPNDMDSSSAELKHCLITADLPAYPLPELPDIAATHAEAVFWEAVRVLRQSSSSSEETEVIDSFWPPLDGQGLEDAQDDAEW